MIEWNPSCKLVLFVRTLILGDVWFSFWSVEAFDFHHGNIHYKQCGTRHGMSGFNGLLWEIFSCGELMGVHLGVSCLIRAILVPASLIYGNVVFSKGQRELGDMRYSSYPRGDKSRWLSLSMVQVHCLLPLFGGHLPLVKELRFAFLPCSCI